MVPLGGVQASKRLNEPFPTSPTCPQGFAIALADGAWRRIRPRSPFATRRVQVIDRRREVVTPVPPSPLNKAPLLNAKHAATYPHNDIRDTVSNANNAPETKSNAKKAKGCNTKRRNHKDYNSAHNGRSQQHAEKTQKGCQKKRGSELHQAADQHNAKEQNANNASACIGDA